MKRGEHAERAASQLMNGGYFRLIKRHFCLN